MVLWCPSAKLDGSKLVESGCCMDGQIGALTTSHSRGDVH